MQRKIKFRAWCEEDKVLIYDLNSPRLIHGVLKDDLYIFNQFTGLLDKNSKDIYEGDIIKHNYLYSDKRDVYAVVKFGKYDDDEGYSTYHHLGWYLDEINGDGQHSLIDLRPIEIIGNIYENKIEDFK